jgi:hypothetical protein
MARGETIDNQKLYTEYCLISGVGLYRLRALRGVCDEEWHFLGSMLCNFVQFPAAPPLGPKNMSRKLQKQDD